jgi:hypothetical protein
VKLVCQLSETGSTNARGEGARLRSLVPIIARLSPWSPMRDASYHIKQPRNVSSGDWEVVRSVGIYPGLGKISQLQQLEWAAGRTVGGRSARGSLPIVHPRLRQLNLGGVQRKSGQRKGKQRLGCVVLRANSHVLCMLR